MFVKKISSIQILARIGLGLYTSDTLLRQRVRIFLNFYFILPFFFVIKINNFLKECSHDPPIMFL